MIIDGCKLVFAIVALVLQAARSSAQSNISIPAFLTDARTCPLSACEVLVYMSQHYLQQQKAHYKSVPEPKNGEPSADGKMVEMMELEYQVEQRIRAVERRLRSVEQPVWHLSEGSDVEWNRCAEGHCRCLVVTKSLSCWNSGLNSVPKAQTVPMDTLTIDLSENRLSTLNKETFRGLTHLAELDLSHNELDYLPPDLFSDLDGLMKLRLQQNQLEDLYAESFLKLRNLQMVDLSHNRFLKLPATLLHTVNRLSVINLAHNRLAVLPAELLSELRLLEEFDISKNELTSVQSGTFHELRHLRALDLSENFIETISDTAFLQLDRLETLNIRENRLSEISRDLLRNLSSLTHLDLSLNRILYIHLDAFENTRNLVELFLGQNSLSAIPSRLFRNQAMLRKLMIFSNNLTALYSDTFVGLGNVTSLLLNNNVLRDLHPEVFRPLHNLVKLRLDSNKLQFLPPGCLDVSAHITAVKLDKNPWHCDCKAIYLARWLRSYIHKLWDNEPKCRGPGDLGGNPVGDLRFSDMCDGQWASMVSLAPRIPVNNIDLTVVSGPYVYLQENFTNATMNAQRRRVAAEAQAAEEAAVRAANVAKPLFSPVADVKNHSRDLTGN